MKEQDDSGDMNYYFSNIMFDLVDKKKKKMLKVLVKPNSKETKITAYDNKQDIFHINVKAAPENNRANLALMKFISKIIKRKVEIISGATSKIKLIKILDG